MSKAKDPGVEFMAAFFRDMFGKETEEFYRAQAAAAGYYALQPKDPIKTAPAELIERAVELWFKKAEPGASQDDFWKLPTWEKRHWLDRAAEDEKPN